MVIATLGPPGTCSEKAAHYFDLMEKLDGTIVLRDSFEDAVDMTLRGDSSFAIVPAAYPGIADIFFDNIDRLSVHKLFLHSTPDFVFACQKNSPYPQGTIHIISHRAPIILSRQVSEIFDVEISTTLAQSNAVAAIKIAEGEFSYGITNAASANHYGLQILVNFGPVHMAWLAFAMKAELTVNSQTMGKLCQLNN